MSIGDDNEDHRSATIWHELESLGKLRSSMKMSDSSFLGALSKLNVNLETDSDFFRESSKLTDSTPRFGEFSSK